MKEDEQAIDQVLNEKIITDLEVESRTSNAFSRLALFFFDKLHLQSVLG